MVRLPAMRTRGNLLRVRSSILGLAILLSLAAVITVWLLSSFKAGTLMWSLVCVTEIRGQHSNITFSAPRAEGYTMYFAIPTTDPPAQVPTGVTIEARRGDATLTSLTCVRDTNSSAGLPIPAGLAAYRLRCFQGTDTVDLATVMPGPRDYELRIDLETAPSSTIELWISVVQTYRDRQRDERSRPPKRRGGKTAPAR